MWTDAARRANHHPTIRLVALAAARRRVERQTAEHAARRREPVRHPSPEQPAHDSAAAAGARRA